jgi:dipeptide/tripeptide permease
MVVNIGAFIGKTVVKDIRQELGVANVPYFSAAAAAVALVLVILFYWPKAREDARPHNLAETVRGMIDALLNFRFLALILITAGFWAIQGQLYASMPEYVLRLVGEGAAPEWYANINPLVVVIFVVPVTHLIRKWRPELAISVALALIPFSALTMSLSHLFKNDINLFGYLVHPITMMMVIGISIQGFCECFLSPKYLEYASKQAPKGQEGLYLGYAHMNVFFAWLFGFVFAGHLLKWYCPNPTTLTSAEQAQRLAAIEGTGTMPEVYANAHYLWYAFALVGLVSFLALLVYIRITKKLDARKG